MTIRDAGDVPPQWRIGEGLHPCLVSGRRLVLERRRDRAQPRPGHGHPTPMRCAMRRPTRCLQRGGAGDIGHHFPDTDAQFRTPTCWPARRAGAPPRARRRPDRQPRRQHDRRPRAPKARAAQSRRCASGSPGAGAGGRPSQRRRPRPAERIGQWAAAFEAIEAPAPVLASPHRRLGLCRAPGSRRDAALSAFLSRRLATKPPPLALATSKLPPIRCNALSTIRARRPALISRRCARRRRGRTAPSSSAPGQCWGRGRAPETDPLRPQPGDAARLRTAIAARSRTGWRNAASSSLCRRAPWCRRQCAT